MSESTKSSMFTEEQRLRIAANHARALQLKEARLKREAAAAQAPTAVRPPQPMQAPNSSQSQTTLRPVQVKYARKDDFNPNVPSTSSLQQVEVSATLINSKRFKVTYYPVRDALVEVCRSLNTRVYDRDMKAWHFALSDYKQAEVAFKSVKTLNVTFKGFDETVKKIFQSDIEGQATNQVVLTPPDLSKIDSSLLDKVFPFQRAGITFGVQKNGRVLIADEMGLGKTVQGLGIARYFKNEWPLLIICPSSVKFAWSTQIAKFLPSVASQVSVIEKSGDMLPDRRTSDTIVIISYDQMSTRIAQLVKFGFRVVIFDESHMIKDSKAKRTLSAHQLTKGANRVLLLSGTPALSRPAELFNQIKAVSPDLFRNFVSFAVRYCDGRQGRFSFEAKGATNTEELAAILEKTIMIRRLKKDVLDDLPEKRREMVVIGGNAIKEKMKQLQQAEQSCLSAKDAQERKRKLVEYFSMTGSAKASTVAKHIVDEFFVEGSDERKDDRKVLVFAHHQVVIDTIALEMAKRSLKTIRIDGTTPSKRREELCQHFQTSAECSVALLSITAAGVGITLTAASLVIFAELHWNPGTLVQAEDRAHRMGQKDSVHVQYIVASGTADDHIWPLIQRKLDVLSSVKLSSDSFREADSRSVHTTAVSPNQPTLDSFFGALAAEDSAAEPDAKRFRMDLNGSQIS